MCECVHHSLAYKGMGTGPNDPTAVGPKFPVINISSIHGVPITLLFG